MDENLSMSLVSKKLEVALREFERCIRNSSSLKCFHMPEPLSNPCHWDHSRNSRHRRSHQMAKLLRGCECVVSLEGGQSHEHHWFGLRERSRLAKLLPWHGHAFSHYTHRPKLLANQWSCPSCALPYEFRLR